MKNRKTLTAIIIAAIMFGMLAPSVVANPSGHYFFILYGSSGANSDTDGWFSASKICEITTSTGDKASGTMILCGAGEESSCTATICK